MTYEPKTKQFSHQERELKEHGADKVRAIWWEPGTGKSKQHCDQAALLYEEKEVDGSFLVAPNGLHRNFVNREIPKHLPDRIVQDAAIFYWKTEKSTTKRHQNEAREFLESNKPFKFLAMSYDAVLTDKGKALANAYLLGMKKRLLYGLDESQRIKNPESERAQAILKSSPFANYKRIYTGTPIAAAPWDAYPQIKFLDGEFWKGHGLDSPEAMKAAFGIWDRTGRKVPVEMMRKGLLTEGSLARASEGQIAQHNRMKAWYDSKGVPPELRPMFQMMGPNEAMMLIPSIAKNENGRPRYKNLDRLRDILAPIRDRVLKADVFDLPGKMYQTIEFEMSPAQMRAYKSMQELGYFMLDDRACTANMALVLLLRLQQIACGYLVTDLEHGEEDPTVLPILPNPRMDILKEIVEDIPTQGLIWARFTSDIDAIVAELRKMGKTAAPYYGKITDEECGKNEQRFHDGDVQWLVLNQAKGSEGLTLVEAKTAIWYSNSFKFIERMQGEDRPDRYGQDSKVNNIDLVARDSVDENIVENLLGKYDIHTMITGDRMRSWLKGSHQLI